MVFQLTKTLFYALVILLQQRDSLETVFDERHLCGRYTCDGDRLTQPCSCDVLCVIYGDCCPDYTNGWELRGSGQVAGNRDTDISQSVADDRQSQDVGDSDNHIPQSMGDDRQSQVAGDSDTDVHQSVDDDSQSHSNQDPPVSRHTPRRVGNGWDSATQPHTPVSVGDHVPLVDPSLVSCVDLRFSVSYLLISKCPSRWKNEYVREMCESEWPGLLHEYLIPVTSVITGLLYKNMFCAACNAELIRDVYAWPYNVDCGKITTSDDFFNQVSNCGLVFKEPARRLCIGGARRCPTVNTTDAVTRKCNRFVDYVSVEQYYYQNRYCVECNGVSMERSSCFDRNFMGEFSHNRRVSPMSSLADLWAKPDNMKTVINVTLEPKLGCRSGVFYNGRCFDRDCPMGFDDFQQTRDDCKFTALLRVSVCGAMYADSTQMYSSISARLIHIKSSYSYGQCNDRSETIRVHVVDPIADVDALISIIRNIATHSTFDYRKLSVVPGIYTKVKNAIRARFSRNCSTLNHVGSAAENYAVALSYLMTLNSSVDFSPVLFSLSNRKTENLNTNSDEKAENSNVYRLTLDICYVDNACHVMSSKNLLPYDRDALADKIWEYHDDEFVCLSDLERYEDRKREARNKNLVKFFVDQHELSRVDVNSACLIDTTNTVILCVVVILISVMSI